jgi:cytosine/adenosine deaminase-related metal-dependent hydrolase
VGLGSVGQRSMKRAIIGAALTISCGFPLGCADDGNGVTNACRGGCNGGVHDTGTPEAGVKETGAKRDASSEAAPPARDAANERTSDASRDAARPDGGRSLHDAAHAPLEATSERGIVLGPDEVLCEALPALKTGTCAVTPHGSARRLVGTVLTPHRIYRGGRVVIDASGTIVGVGCKPSCDGDPACAPVDSDATVISCPQGVISPGLVNTHDHLGYTHDWPIGDSGLRYEQRNDWRLGLRQHQKLDVPGGATPDQIAWGELRFLFGGATSTVGAGRVQGLIRNLEAAGQEGLDRAALKYDTFPLGDNNGPQLSSGCGYPNVVLESTAAAASAYLPHVAEGIDDVARNEFSCLSSANTGHDIVKKNAALIHGIALTPPDYAEMARAGAALIWSPRSAMDLYGGTGTVTAAARLGVLVALGTDWVATGSMNLLRELSCADSLNRTYFESFFSDRDLWLMVTENAAIATGTDDVLGVLAPGKVGDVAIFDGERRSNYRAVIDAAPEDVALVMRGGRALYGESAVLSALPEGAGSDELTVCGATRRVQLEGEIGKSFADLTAAVGSIYPIFYCGPPADEPTCTPARSVSVNGSSIYDGSSVSGDIDGDGVADASDDCPGTWNPIRPVDNGVQADFDGDGVGDACDPCPLGADATACSVGSPYDRDGDGIPSEIDNCPAVANADQADSDGDMHGDACDTCPKPNPGANGCPASIYEIKDGTFAPGAVVALSRALVTARNASGYFVQVKPSDADYAGPDYSGLFVFAPQNAVRAGDRVTLSPAIVQSFFGELEIANAAVVSIDHAGEAPPAPVDVTAADVATGGARAAPLDGVLVRLAGASVTDVAPPVGARDTAPTNEFVVGGNVLVDDLLYLVSPFPSVGTTYVSITGVLAHRNDADKIEPRGPSDYEPPGL